MKNLALLFIVVFLFPSIAVSKTIHVPVEQATIQAGIDAAEEGDIVLVAPWIYSENIDFKGKAITVASVEGPETTILWGWNPVNPWNGSVVTFDSREGPDSVLDGFTLTGGCGKEIPIGSFDTFGGGICCINISSPSIRNCIICENAAERGGGIYCEFGNPQISDCIIDDNYAEDSGGAAYISDSDPIFTDCLFSENTCFGLTGSGGGICNHTGHVTLNRCTLFKNEHQGAWGNGGGINNYLGKITASHCVFERNRIELAYDGGAISNTQGELDLTDCVFKYNSVDLTMANDTGGAVYSRIGTCSITRCLFYENQAGFYGGGIAAFSTNLTVNDCVFSRNAGAGAAIFCKDTNATLTNCTFYDNWDYGKDKALYCTDQSDVVITNSIFWNEPEPDSVEIWIAEAAAPSSVSISHSNVVGGTLSVHVDPGNTLNWGAGMIDEDPLFMDPFWLDFHIPFTSPCRGSGDNTAPMLSEFDFEGDPRIFQGTVDMGADEFAPHFYCSGDFQPLGSITGNFVGLPGTAPTGLFIGSGLLDPPFHHAWGDFYLQAPWILLPLVPVPQNGVLSIPETIPGIPDAPYDIYLQALIGDVLTNLFILEVR